MHYITQSFFITNKRGLVRVAPACAGSREGSEHFGSYVHSISLHFYKRLFPRLEPMTSWSLLGIMDDCID
jgi:hypothetical protein